MAGEQISPYVAGLMGNSLYIKNEDYDNSITGKLHRMNPFAETRWEDNQYKPNPYYPHNVNLLPQSTFKAGVTDAAEIAAEKAEREAREQAINEQAIKDRSRAVDLVSKATGDVRVNAFSDEIPEPEVVQNKMLGYSPEYIASERDRLRNELAQMKALQEAKYDAKGLLLPGLWTNFSPEVRRLQQQVSEYDRLYEDAKQRRYDKELGLAQARAAADINKKLKAAGVDELVSYKDIAPTAAFKYMNKVNQPPQQPSTVNGVNTTGSAANTVTPSVLGVVNNAVDTVGSMFGVPNTQAIPTTTTTTTSPPTTTSPTTSATNVATPSATKPTATTSTQGTRTATPTATRTARVAPTPGGGVYQGGLPPKQPQPTATTGGGVYRGGLPPKQPMAPQPVPQQVVGYVPPPVRDGYDMVGSAKGSILPGQPISRAVAREMYRNQAETNQLYNQMMSSARTSQVMDAMNNPDTYRVAETFARQGMPMDRAMHLAMTQTTAANGDWLGTGATIPAGQKALSDMNDRNMQFSFMLGTPWEAREVNGPVYMANPYFRAMNPNGTIVTTDGTKTGLNNNQMMFAAAGANNPLAANQALANANMQSQVNVTNMLNKNSYGNSGNGGGSNANISNKADQLIKNADKKAEENTTPTSTNTVLGL